jgi:hypothetical protein
MEENWQEEELAKLRAEFKSENREFNQHTDVVKKMRSFLSMAGEKTSKETGELFREHVPQSVFGISSDEIASDLGMTENELMERITDGLSIKSRSYIPRAVKVARIILSEVQKRINKEQRRIEWLKEHFGCVYYGELKKLTWQYQ